MKVAQQDSNRSGHYIVAYQCFDCHQWHVGHADFTQTVVVAQKNESLAPTVVKIPVGEDGRVCKNPECSNGLPEKGLTYCTKNCRNRHRILKKQEAAG